MNGKNEKEGILLEKKIFEGSGTWLNQHPINPMVPGNPVLTIKKAFTIRQRL